MEFIVPEESQFEAFLHSGSGGQSVTLCHLLKFRDQADYSDRPSEASCSGRDAYHRYLDKATEYIERHGGKVLCSGKVDCLLIGPETETWDEVLVVQFPSVETVTGMMNSDYYQEIAHHRLAGLKDTRLLTLSTDS